MFVRFNGFSTCLSATVTLSEMDESGWCGDDGLGEGSVEGVCVKGRSSGEGGESWPLSVNWSDVDQAKEIQDTKMPIFRAGSH